MTRDELLVIMNKSKVDAAALSALVNTLALPDTVVTIPPDPTVITVGSGSKSFILKIQQDFYQVDAQYTVKVDGVQVGGTVSAKSKRVDGVYDTVTVKGEWVDGSHSCAVTFVNDAWDGGTGDRNLYVVTPSGLRLSFMGNGSQSFSVAIGVVAPPTSGARGTWADFSKAMRIRESSNNYQATNTHGALGAYQHHENTMAELGLYVGDTNFSRPNDWSGTFNAAAVAIGFSSVATYLNCPSCQDEVWRRQCDFNFKRYVKGEAGAGWDLGKYVGKIMNGSMVTVSALLGAMNLLGPTGARRYVDSGGTVNDTDAFGTKASDYFILFSNYDTLWSAGYNPR